jgi:hypothetical protein
MKEDKLCDVNVKTSEIGIVGEPDKKMFLTFSSPNDFPNTSFSIVIEL